MIVKVSAEFLAHPLFL